MPRVINLSAKFKWIWLTVPEIGQLQFFIDCQFNPNFLKVSGGKKGSKFIFLNQTTREWLPWPEWCIMTYCAWGCVQISDMWPAEEAKVVIIPIPEILELQWPEYGYLQRVDRYSGREWQWNSIHVERNGAVFRRSIAQVKQFVIESFLELQNIYLVQRWVVKIVPNFNSWRITHNMFPRIAIFVFISMQISNTKFSEKLLLTY